MASDLGDAVCCLGEITIGFLVGEQWRVGLGIKEIKMVRMRKVLLTCIDSR